MMKPSTLIVAALALLLGGVGQAEADIVYDNGAINGTIGEDSIYTTQGIGIAVSDSFMVSGTGTTTLTGAQHVGIWVALGATPSALQWSIGTTAFGSDISSSSGIVSVSMSSTLLANNYPLNTSVYDVSFTLNGTVSDGTTYWLTLTDATASSGGFVAWDVSNGPSAVQQDDTNGKTYSIDGSNAFQLTGNAATVAAPEPASLTLAGIGAVSLLGYGWRRQKKVAPPLAV